MERGGPAIIRTAKIVAEAWSNLSDCCGEPAQHLAALTESLDDLCVVLGLEPPGDVIDIIRRMRAAQAAAS